MTCSAMRSPGLCLWCWWGAHGLAEKLWKAPGYEQLSILLAPAHIRFISCEVTHSSPFSVAQGPASSLGVRLTGVALTSSLEPPLPRQ